MSWLFCPNQYFNINNNKFWWWYESVWANSDCVTSALSTLYVPSYTSAHITFVFTCQNSKSPTQWSPLTRRILLFCKEYKGSNSAWSLIKSPDSIQCTVVDSRLMCLAFPAIIGRWILPATVSVCAPVVSLNTFSSPSRHRNPRKANIRASLKLIVASSACSRLNFKPFMCTWIRSIKYLFNAPPPVTRTLGVLELVNLGITAKQAFATMVAMCSVQVRSKSSTQYASVWKYRNDEYQLSSEK